MGLWWEVYTYSVDSTLSSLLLVDVPSGDLEVVVISILGISSSPLEAAFGD